MMLLARGGGLKYILENRQTKGVVESETGLYVLWGDMHYIVDIFVFGMTELGCIVAAGALLEIVQ